MIFVISTFLIFVILIPTNGIPLSSLPDQLQFHRLKLKHTPNHSFKGVHVESFRDKLRLCDCVVGGWGRRWKIECEVYKTCFEGFWVQRCRCCADNRWSTIDYRMSGLELKN